MLHKKIVKMSYVGRIIAAIGVPQLIKKCSYGHFRKFRQNFVKISYVGRIIATIGLKLRDHCCNWVKVEEPFL